MRAILSPVLRYWRGDVAVWFAIIGPCLGLRFAMMAVAPNITWPLVTLVLWIAICLGVLVWQATGLFRATERLVRDMPASPLVWGAYATLILLVALTVIQIADALAAKSDPQTDVGPANDPLIVPVEAGVLSLSGEITIGHFGALQSALKTHPETHSLHLTSPGGHIPTARGLARLVLEAGLMTQATGMCASACTLVFLAGDERRLGADGALGFHGYNVAERSAAFVNLAEEEAKDRAFALSRGVAPDFVERMFDAPHHTLWQPDPMELAESGVVTHP